VLVLLNAEMLQDLGIYQAFNREFLYSIIRELRPTTQRATTEAMVVKALSDEFRVRMAQLTLETADPAGIYRRTKEKLMMDSNPEVRVPLSPAMLWDSFKADRSEFDVAMVPVTVEDFVGQIEAPTEAELKSLFAEGKNNRYDPSSPTPG